VTRLLALTSLICLVAVFLAGTSLWYLSAQRSNEILCLRATLAYLMDASVRAAREGGAPDAALRARLFEQAKRDLLTPRDCPAVEQLQQS